MKQINVKELENNFNVAVIASRFNEDVTEKLLEGALERLTELEFSDEQITVVKVPGAIELPVTAQRFAKTKKYQAIICIGAVIRGETTHYDYVCEQASDGCLRVSLDHELPVIFGVITTENKEQALARAGGDHGHKGRDAVDAAYEMVSVLSQIA